MRGAGTADERGMRWLGRATVAALVAILPGLAAPIPVPAEPASPPSPPPSAEAPPTPPPPPLAPPRADEAGRRQAEAELRKAESALKGFRAAEAKAAQRVPASERRVQEAQARLVSLDADQQELARQLAAARGRVRDLAVASYVTGGSSPSLDYLLKARNPLDLMRRGALVDSAADLHRSAATTYEAARAAASEQLDAAVRDLELATAEHAQVVSEANAAAEQARRAAAQVEHQASLLQLVTAAAPVAPSDIPRLFLDAYRRAATALQKRAPGCRVGWTAIAAIGKIESNHGRFRDAQLALNGDVFPRITGIPLDGTNNTRVITDTDGGVLDGDVVYDRAVGPMQFIPSTWKRLAQDGNGDGVSDPNNAYDAALGTAAYLCRAVPTGGLDLEEPLRPAFFSYNHSDAYVEAALALFRAYEAVAPQLPPPPPPPPPPKPPGKGRKR
jgi:membrane-bound lytic murein transglycosylase B